MLLPNWVNRPHTVAFLLNPAFCGEVLKRCIIEYQKINNSGISFQLIFLILPFILNQSIRDILPMTSRKNFISWLEENQIIKKDLTQSIKAMVPYTKESIMFLMMYGIVDIDEKGRFKIIKKNKSFKGNNEVTDCYKKAAVMGKLLAKAGSSQFIFTNIGIKP